MGVLRIVRYGTEFSFRTRRIIFFIIFFIALTGVTLYAVNEISRENTDLLLSQKVVILQEKSEFTGSVTQAQTLEAAFNHGGNHVYIVKYVYIASLKMKIFSADLKEPWSSSIVKPDEIRQGSYITNGGLVGNNTYQALASKNFVPLGSTNTTANVTMSNSFAVDSVQTFTSATGSLNLKIVGLYDKKNTLPAEENWLLVSHTAFDQLTTVLGPSNQVYAYQVVVVAPGYSETVAAMLFGNSISKTQANSDLASKSVSNTNFTLTYAPTINDVKTQATSTDLILLIGGLGSPVVATMYAFIISRFRTREMAVLKAVGYSNRNVQVMILTEIATVSIIGFLISAFGLQILLNLNSQYTLNTTYTPLIWNPFVSLIPSGIAIITFIFVVASNILGFIIISQRTISVRPVELFKNVG